ncbi:CoF synthetase [Arthrobacter sp. PM3]|nr:CoF synthetase [Arthrobacter sp. PM3]
MSAIAGDIWRAERAGQNAIERRQRERLAALVEYARSASPFYRRLYRDVPDPKAATEPGGDLLAVLRELPPVGKRELMDNFDDWVTDPHITLAGLKTDLLSEPARAGTVYRGRYLVLTTSGSTGEPAVLVHDRNSWLVANLLARIRERRTLVSAAEIRAFLRRGLRGAALIADGDHFAGVVMTEMARRRSPSIARRLRVFSVLRPLPELVAELNEFQPTMLYGYPSAMLQLAAEQKAGRLRIRPVMAVASGEALAADDAAAIEAALGCRTTVRYLASEALALTSRCRLGQFHVNADWYIVEPVDEHYQPVPAGQLSHTVLVTNLANRVQPLIRYNLGDRVQMAAAPCACGSPFPALRVEGRSGDLLSFAAGGGAVTVLPLALGTVIEETPGVRRFQAIRTGPRQLTVRLELWPESTTAAVRTAVAERLGAFFAARGADVVEVRFADEPPLPDRSGKFREVWSAWTG